MGPQRIPTVFRPIGGTGGPTNYLLSVQPTFTAGTPRTLSTCRHTTDLRQIWALEVPVGPVVQFHPHLHPPGYLPFLVYPLTLAAPSCCPVVYVQRHPAPAGFVTTVLYRCPLTRMTCVCRVLPVSTCRRLCACANDRNRTTTTTTVPGDL